MRRNRIANMVRASIKTLVRSLPWLMHGRPATVRYSPRGIGDERPNVRDSRFTFPVGDEPVILPMKPIKTAYLLAALFVGAFLVMILLVGR